MRHRTNYRLEASESLVPAYLCLLALAALGCSKAEDPAIASGSTVTIAYGKDGRLFGPDDDDAEFLVFLPLLRYDQNGELEGRLARVWEHSPDYREWTYHLRTDVRWHDGAPVTAADVRFTLQLLTHPDVPPGASLRDFESITVVDDSTITIRSGHPDYYQTEVVYYPKHLLERLDPAELWEWSFWRQPVGNGPYRFVRYLPQTMMELEANPDYYRGQPRIKRVVLKFSGEAGLTDLLSGEVDALALLQAPEQIPRLAADGRFRVYHWYPEQRIRAIYWQCSHSFFRNAKVRRALTLAINRRELLRLLNYPESTPIGGGFYTERQMRRGEWSDSLPYDPTRARALLEEAGWKDGDGDGVRDRDGHPFRFTALVNASVGPNEAIATYVQDQLRRVGVRMEIRALEVFALLDRYKAGQFEALVFNVWLQNRFAEEDSPLGYWNAELVRLMDRLRLTADPHKVDRIYRDITEIFRADAPVTFLFPFINTVVAHRKIRGLRSPWRAHPLSSMEDLWLEEEP